MSRLNIPVGIAMVFALAQSAHAQCETAKLIPTNPVQEDYFGCAMAIDGEWAIVGAYLNDDLAFQGGTAYVFHKSNGAWSQTQQLLASDGQWSDNFGTTVAMSGNWAVIGAPNAASTLGPFTRTGVAYVFERTRGTWVQRAKLVASSPARDDQFGSALAISGQRIAIGAGHADPVGLGSGAAYVFEGTGSAWNQIAQPLPLELGPGDSFGTHVGIDGDRLIVGAPFHAVGSIRPGGAFIFERNAQGTWIEQQVLLDPTPANQNYFGGDVAIQGNKLLVGAPFHHVGGGNSAVVYAYEFTAGAWINTQMLSEGYGTNFGGRIVLGNDLALISTTNQDPDYVSGIGAVYAFRFIGASWQRIGKLMANDPAPGNAYGQYFALNGTTALVGSPLDDVACLSNPNCDSGSAYVVEIAPTAVQYGHCPNGGLCVAGNPDVHGGCANGTGQGAVLQASGSGSVAADDIRFEARHLPPGTSALLFMGGAQTDVLFGNGRRVVAGGSSGVFRLGVQFADAAGVITRGPGLIAQSQGLASAGHIQVGQTWNFQYWYRDLAGACQGAFNLTNGLQATFVP